MNPEVTQVQLLTQDAKMPERFSFQAAGHDLYCRESFSFGGGQTVLVPTGIAVSIPHGYYGRIAPRSGLALKAIHVLGGVIDSDYRGEIKVILFNSSHVKIEFKKHDRIAQLIIEKININSFIQVESLDQTQRGDGGFGSTGN